MKWLTIINFVLLLIVLVWVIFISREIHVIEVFLHAVYGKNFYPIW